MNRAELKSRLHASLDLDEDLVTILCDYGLELQEIIRKFEQAYEIVEGEPSRTERYFLLRILTEDILFDNRKSILETIDKLKKEK